MIKITFLVLSAELFNSIGQVLFKKSSNLHPPPDLGAVQAYLDFFVKVIVVPWIWVGLGLMTVGLFVWLLAMAQADLSVVYPLGSLYYVLVLILARVFLKEKINRPKVVGTVLIGLGIVLITGS